MEMQAIFERRNTPKRGGGERRNSDAANIAAALERRGRVSLCVQGTSMLPWVRPGDIANIRRVSADAIRCGDVVLFRRKSQLFVHRIIEKRGARGAAQFRAKGDAHPTCDGLLEQQELLGRVMRIYRRGRRIDLDAPGQLALGFLISQLSLRSRFWYPLARLAAIVTRPVRRLLHAMQPSGELAR
ncbi:MAG: signal peptidase I [Candidatus Acidiferrales bacterium]